MIIQVSPAWECFRSSITRQSRHQITAPLNWELQACRIRECQIWSLLPSITSFSEPQTKFNGLEGVLKPGISRQISRRERNLFIRQLPYIVSGKGRRPLFTSYTTDFCLPPSYSIQKKTHSPTHPRYSLRTPVKKRRSKLELCGLNTGLASSYFSQ